MDIMFVIVTTIFLDFTPPSRLVDARTMTIANDSTPMSEMPMRWRMPQLSGAVIVLGLFSIVATFALSLIGMRVLSRPHLFGTGGQGAAADRDVPAVGKQWSFAAVHRPHAALVPPMGVSLQPRVDVYPRRRSTYGERFAAYAGACTW